MNKLRMRISIIALISIILISCNEREDPGPLQDYEKQYAVVDFDRLEMGSSFNIQVEEASTFSIDVEGDSRNIDDLEVSKQGTTLVIKYKDDNANRKHQTNITIKMPKLYAVNFSGASVSVIKGFESEDNLDFYLSGASVSQLDAGYRSVNIVLSGASKLVMRGLGDELKAEISGASALSAFDYPIRKATLKLSGASHGKVTTSDELIVDASGASDLLYRGDPLTTIEVSGASDVERD